MSKDKTLSHVQLAGNITAMITAHSGMDGVLRTTIQDLSSKIPAIKDAEEVTISTGFVKLIKHLAKAWDDSPYAPVLKLWETLSKEDRRRFQNAWDYTLSKLGLRASKGDSDTPLNLAVVLGALRSERHYGTREQWQEVSALVSKLSRTNITEPKEAEAPKASAKVSKAPAPAPKVGKASAAPVKASAKPRKASATV